MNDQLIRQSCFEALNAIVSQYGSVVPWSIIAEGFIVANSKVFFATKAQGIFKPRQLEDGAALSIRTAKPSRSGRFAPYSDDELSEGLFKYHLERTGRDNHLLRVAHKNAIPLVYFRGCADAEYEVIFPVFVRGIDTISNSAVIEIGNHEIEIPSSAQVAEIDLEKGYRNENSQRRIHQSAFRNRVLKAYRNRCAISGLPIPQLLEAAHIINDSRGGMPWVKNGIALSRLHHVAYERNLLGIDPDNRVHVSRRVLKISDGPLLTEGIQRWNGKKIYIPDFVEHRPKKEFLAARYEEFVHADTE